MTNSKRQHGIGSLAPDEKIVGKPGGLVEPGVKQYGIFKKIKKAVKKVVKSPLGKIGIGALLAGAPIGGGGWFGSGSGWGKGIGFLRNRGILGSAANKGFLYSPAAGKTLNAASTAGTNPGMLSKLWSKVGDFGYGKSALLGLGAVGMALPFMAGKPEEEEEEDDWSITPSSIANIRNMARNRDSSLAFLPSNAYTQAGYYLADGGRAGLTNGGGVAEAQAENMLKMEYQKYRNQGGTMSYQQFKMAVLQQAQSQGPMAQGQPQMAASGGRMGYQGGELVEDESMIAETPTGMMEENVEEIQGEPTREQMEALAMEIFQLRLEELDEEQLMVVYQAAMEQQPQEGIMQEADIQMAARGGRIGLLGGGPVPGSTVPGYTTPVGYNKYDYRTGGVPVRVGAANGGIMPLLDLGGKEKDYRQDGGFVGIGRKEKADDVPARLSKNEFVFTADAVRNAGGGDIDAGAEVMQNMMDNLEQGGQISEESQGAQGMYNQQQMLQSRMA